MKYNAVQGIVVAILALSAAVLFRGYQLRSELESTIVVMKEQRASLCEMQLGMMESAAIDKNPKELRARVQFRFLSASVLQFCLGTTTPVETNAADMCWIGSGEDTCYVGVLKDLVKAYRDNRSRWQ